MNTSADPQNTNGLDEYDRKILDLLENNARLAYTEIGSQIGLSRVSVRNRIERMEQDGIIRGYHAVIDRAAAPEGIRFSLDIEVSQDRIEDVAEALSYDTRVRQIFRATGVGILRVHGIARNSADLDSYVRRLDQRFKDARCVRVSILLSVYKDADNGIEYVRPAKTDEPQL